MEAIEQMMERARERDELQLLRNNQHTNVIRSISIERVVRMEVTEGNGSTSPLRSVTYWYAIDSAKPMLIARHDPVDPNCPTPDAP